MWLMKGPFSEAIEDTDTVIWKKSDDGKFSLSILAVRFRLYYFNLISKYITGRHAN